MYSNLKVNPSTGQIQATSYTGDGSALTGVGFTVFPYAVNPDVSGHVNANTGIGFTWNQKVLPGTGDINLRRVSAAGTIAQGWDVDTAEVSFESNSTETIMQSVTQMEPDSVYCVEIPGNALTAANGAAYVGTAYTFYNVAAQFELNSWGTNNQGALGRNQGPGQLNKGMSPSKVHGDAICTSIMGSFLNNAHIFTGEGGKMWAFGMGNNGRLGTNTPETAERSSPTQIPGTTWKHSFGCGQGAIASKTDGTMWGWGGQDTGAIGLNNLTDYSSPVQIPGTNWFATKHAGASANSQYSGAIKTDGTLWTWGGNQYGQLGQNQGTTDYSSPRQIPGTNWKQICFATGSNGWATRTDGTLWSWGPNFYGQLGFPPAQQFYRRSSPVQIPGTNWSYVTGKQQSAWATRTDGTLWAWGYNNNGQLGLNNKSNKNSPNQIPGTNWLWVESSSGTLNNTMAMKDDKSLWSWGEGNQGNLGLGQNQNYSSPRQIPGTWGDGGSESYKYFNMNGSGQAYGAKYNIAP